MTDSTGDFSIGSLTLSGALTANGAVTLGNASGDDITITGSLASSIPIKTTDTYNVGTAALGLLSIYFGNNTQTVRLMASGSATADWTLTLPVAAGTAGQVAQNSGSGTLVWAPGQTDIKAVASGDYTVLDDDGFRHVHVTTGASDRTITLPTASDNTDRMLVIKKVDSGAGKVIVDGEGAETIDAWTTAYLAEQYDNITIVCDGTGWHVLHADYYPKEHQTASFSFNNHNTLTAQDSGIRYHRDGPNMVIQAAWRFTGGTIPAAGNKVSFDVPGGYTFTGTDEVTIVGGVTLNYSADGTTNGQTPFCSGLMPDNSGAEIAISREDFTAARANWGKLGGTNEYFGAIINCSIPITEWALGA